MQLKIAVIGFVATFISSICMAASNDVSSSSLVLITTPPNDAAIRVIDGSVNADFPGYRAELFEKAAGICGYKVEYIFAPRNRALRLIEYGRADGSFRASDKDERAVYGVFPRTSDGTLDVSRAVSNYTYSLYALNHCEFLWDGEPLPAGANRVAVETGAAVIGRLKSLGAEIVVGRDYQNLLELLAAQRVHAVAAITDSMTAASSSSPIEYSEV